MNFFNKVPWSYYFSGNLISEIKVLEQIFTSAAEGILICDNRGVILLANPRTLDLFGYSKEELVGKSLEILLPDDLKKTHKKHRDQYLMKPNPRAMGAGLDLHGRKKNGEVFPLEISLNPFEYGERSLTAAFIIDITERKRLEKEVRIHNENLEKLVIERTQELEHLNLGLQTQVHERKLAEKELLESQKKLEAMLEKERELNVLKSRFVSMASHEFRTPLSTILSSISLIDRYVDEVHASKRSKHIEKVKNSVKHLTDILDDFLSIGKLEEGKITTKIEEMELGQFVRNIMEDVKPLLKEKQELRCKCNGDVHFNSDRKILRQILINLLSNAIKYSDKGIIELTIKEMAKGIRFSVKDRGIGIPLADQKNMFSRFFRAGNATNIEGTGLGLNLVSKYVDLLSGKVEFESEEGVGTTFFVTLNKNN